MRMDSSPIPFRYDVKPPSCHNNIDNTATTTDQNNSAVNHSHNALTNGSGGGGGPTNNALMHETIKILQEFKEVMDDKLSDEELASEWREVAIVLDRLFFILISSTTIVCTLIILYFKQSDNEYDIDDLEHLK